MCGVVSIIYSDNNPNLGNEASSLLKRLEYRGYDSTGGLFYKKGSDKPELLKEVGKPSDVVKQLNFGTIGGNKFIGQVRWATFGAVNKQNAQPHIADCKGLVAGAHNGNIANAPELTPKLKAKNHQVKSQNDGEMLLHTLEEKFYNLSNDKKTTTQNQKVKMFIDAIRVGNKDLNGSYASCVAVEGIEGIFAVKAGSSLYAGKGHDNFGDFIVVSSDLTSVLSKTRFLIPLKEGEGIYFTHKDYKVFSLREKKEHKPGLVRSKLGVADVELRPEYKFFMEQEIFSTADNLEPLHTYYFYAERSRKFFPVLEKVSEDAKSIYSKILRLYNIFEEEEFKKHFLKTVESKKFLAIKNNLDHKLLNKILSHSNPFVSSSSELFYEIREKDDTHLLDLIILDLIVLWKKKRITLLLKEKFIQLVKKRAKKGGKLYFIGAGTSYHASLIASYFFNDLAGISVISAIPGVFRNFHLNSLSENDIIVPVTQSGETKDLIDIIDEIRTKYGKKIRIVSVVNNENSRIPQEKSNFYLPILCGPEIAVAATKSFTNQCALFYILAFSFKNSEKKVERKFVEVIELIDSSLTNLSGSVYKLADELYLKPSMHILGASLLGLAKEGALKIREVVLNHTEGFDAAEFKHGPNTILGQNTIFSLNTLEKVLMEFSQFVENQIIGSTEKQRECFIEFMEYVKEHRFRRFKDAIESSENCTKTELKKLYTKFNKDFDINRMFANYPLIFICPPDERDQRITITQINTHKIRGADIVLFAPEFENMENAVSEKPSNLDEYYSNYIKMQCKSDKYAFVFEAAVLLQLLAFKMSVSKLKFLNRLYFKDHGVHPDVPKNVSKSITVD